MEFTLKQNKLLTKRKPTYVLNRLSGRTLKRRRSTTSCKKCICNSTKTGNGIFEFPTIWEELRINNQLCDGIVRCDDGSEYHIHRIILSAVSPYFRALFTNSINRGQPEVREANIRMSSSAFRVLLDYAYTGTCVINKSNVLEVLQYADQYEILDVVRLCCQFLMQDLSASNCLQVLKFAGQFFCKELMERGNIFVRQNFTSVLKQNIEFSHISMKYLQEILADDYLNVRSEEVVCDAIFSWINFAPEIRRIYLFDLIKCVRLGNLSYEKVTMLSKLPLVERDPACQSYISDVLTILSVLDNTETDCVNTYLLRPRIPYDVLFAIGGWSAGSPTNFVETYDNRADRWLLSTDTDLVPRAYHGMCTYADKIYLVGGFDGNEYFNTVRCFDPLTHKWSSCACMYYSRCYVSVVLCLGKMYAMGGYNGRMRMNSAERYDPIKNQWELITSMQKQRSDAGAAAVNGKIYIIGGFSGQEVMNSGEVYDPSTNQWSYIPLLASPRSGVSLICYKTYLYALGGFNGYTRLPSCEKYCPDGNLGWIEIPEMMTPRSNFGTVILDESIYVIGGFNGSTTINYVEYYDPETNEWIDAASMNLNRSALSACVISALPNARDYSLLDRNLKQMDHDPRMITNS